MRQLPEQPTRRVLVAEGRAVGSSGRSRARTMLWTMSSSMILSCSVMPTYRRISSAAVYLAGRIGGAEMVRCEGKTCFYDHPDNVRAKRERGSERVAGRRYVSEFVPLARNTYEGRDMALAGPR